MKWFWPALALLAWHAGAADRATLVIVDGDSRRELTRPQLLARPDVETITVGDSVYHQRVTRFKAIAIAHLFEGLPVPADAVIQCVGSDGFAALLRRTRLFAADPGTSHAYLAIEEPDHPWPILDGQDTSAGPFYVVWIDPQASAIGREEWPFKVTTLKVVADPDRLFPHSRPGAAAGSAVAAGFESFQKNCLPCHRMNGDGDGTVGPDLNRPANPSSYLQPAALKALIRDPASLRSWPGMVMRGFSREILPDEELADLLAYINYERVRGPGT